MLNKVIASALVLGLSFAIADEEPKKKAVAPKIDPKTLSHDVDLTQFKLDAGKEIFEANCASCHGAIGKGDGAAAAALNPKPRDLSNYKYMSSRTWKELRDVVALGGANAGMSALMPAWKGALKNPQIDNVLAYVITLSSKDEKKDEKKPAKK
jgi:mono/diheme cytochrome c family protein